LEGALRVEAAGAIERPFAVRHDVEQAARKVLSIMSEEAHFPAAEPLAHCGHGCSQIWRRSFPLRSASAKGRQGLEDQEVDENQAMPFVLESRCEVYGG
jgi:hypothetical protein